MERGVLTRIDQSDQGTFGRLVLGDLAVFTGELPWRDNASSISCIPVGEYVAYFTMSNRFHRMMCLVANVPNRAGIRVHSANFMGGAGHKCQLNGCIALGLRLGVMDGQKCLLLSKPAVRAFDNLMLGKRFILEIKNA